MFRHWLQLLRAPNLFTVPGDPLAGFLLAYGAANGGKALLDPRAALAVLASLCLYSAGLVLNDLLDLDEDRRERPDRPLPSGAVPVRAAKIACGALTLVGLAAMTLVAGQAGSVVAIALALCIGCYNGVTKNIPVLGAMNMGACRGLSLWLGAVAATQQAWPQAGIVLMGAIILTAYIAAVTNLARHETRPSAPVFARVLPALVLFGATLLFHFGLGPIFQRLATTMFAIALAFASAEAGRLFRKPAPPLPPSIGALIRVLLPLQAALCLTFPFTMQARATAIALLVLMPVSRIVGRRFYAS